MRFNPSARERLAGRFTMLKAGVDGPSAQRDPAVIETVAAMLLEIERDGMDAVRRYSEKLDRYTGDLAISEERLRSSGDRLPADLREAIELGSRRTRAFAKEHRAHLQDFEVELVPGLVTGVRYVPVSSVGAYLPAGRFPLTASAFMTLGVADEAGVDRRIACTPPQPDGGPNDAVLYAAHLSGAQNVWLLGGVQALAAMAFGLLDGDPVDMLVGAGNAFVAEAKRALYGRVAIDLPAGPSEVAVIADDSADPDWAAADLLGQAEHGTNSPAALVTPSRELAEAVLERIEERLSRLETAEIAGPAWRDHGTVIVTDDMATAIAVMDELAPEHLELMTADDDAVHAALHNYGSIFLGPWSTVAYSDKGMAGTNHVLPTAGGAKHTAGMSVARYLKALTYQRVARPTTPELAEAVVTISQSEGMAAHRDTALIRLAAESAGLVGAVDGRGD